MRLPILQLSYRLFFGKASNHPGLSAPLQPRFGSLRLPAFPKAKIAFESEEMCAYDGHTVHKLSQRRLTADWLAPRESDCSRLHSKVSSDWLPSYMKATRPVLEIFKMAGYFPDSPRIPHCTVSHWQSLLKPPSSRLKKGSISWKLQLCLMSRSGAGIRTTTFTDLSARRRILHRSDCEQSCPKIMWLSLLVLMHDIPL
jgi:hypothetical protein